ncbi:hypothetical protein V2605_08565 [Tenacibaculum maritimum]|uniref:hypothetical protein n=1 Tax=Tenacibaculum maritimum TaxID=107401 RepID=UPI001330A4E5|nr:hypothetical protein [Tenacibaculum maritimum]
MIGKLLILEKKITFLLIVVFFSCSSDEVPIIEPQEKSFTVQLVTINSTVNIYELATGLPNKFEKN